MSAQFNREDGTCLRPSLIMKSVELQHSLRAPRNRSIATSREELGRLRAGDQFDVDGIRFFVEVDPFRKVLNGYLFGEL